MGQGQSADDSVYDFLYVDAGRIARFLAQFGQYGNLTSLTRTVGKTTTTSGTLNLGAAKGDVEKEALTNQTSGYDPQWIAPLRLLDELGRKAMIVRGVGGARIGQFVLEAGALTILDFATLKSLWDIPAIQKIIAAGMSGAALAAIPTSIDRNAKARTGANLQAQQMNALKPILEVLKILPHGLQARLLTKDQKRIWCGLDDGSLVGSAADLMLKHGSTISGEWNMLGVLDAEPDSDTNNQSAVPQDEVAFFMTSLAPFARTALGRPATAYGMTPLLIFREVSA